MENLEVKQGIRGWITEGIIIAVIPILAYLVTFSYEVGYAGFFLIPQNLITLNIINFFAVCGVLLSLFVILLWPILIYIDLVKKETNVITLRFVKLFPFYLWLVVNELLYGFTLWREWILSLIIAIILSIIEFGAPLLSQRHKGSYNEKLKADLEADLKTETIFDRLLQFLGWKIYLFTLIFIFMLLISYNVGRAEALKKVNFLVVDTSPEVAVLRIYGDYLICVPFDRGSREVQRSFVILNMSESFKTTLKLEKIGPLHPKKL